MFGNRLLGLGLGSGLGESRDVTVRSPLDMFSASDNRGKYRFIVSHNGINIALLSGQILGLRQSRDLVAGVTTFNSSVYLSVKYRGSDSAVPCDLLKMLDSVSYQVHVIDDVIIGFCESGNDVIMAKNHVIHIPHPREQPPEGVLFYDGIIHDITLEKGSIFVQSECVEEPFPKALWTKRQHTVFQDDKYTQYGLILKSSGLVVGVVDLKAKKTVTLKSFSMVGVVDGELGVWRYTKEYLEERFEEQYGMELPREFAEGLK